MPAPIWTAGPSRPRASPVPIASTPPMNFTGIRIRDGGGCSSCSKRLDVRDAASLCPWREFPDEPGGQSGGDGRNTDDEHEASNLLAVRPIDDQPKDGSHKTRCPTHRKRQER